MLKPKDIHEVQFSRAFKGYDPDEVDKFLDKVTEDYSQLYRENAELMNKIDVLAAKLSEFKNAEENLRAAREKVYRLAQEVAAKAKAEAAQTEREAKERAERIVIEAKRDCENQRRTYERLQLEVTRFKAKAISIFKSEIEQLNSLPDLQVDAKDELRIRADEMHTDEDSLSSPFVQEYKPKYVSPAQIDFGLLDSEEDKAKEEAATALKESADPKEDFTSDYVSTASYDRRGGMFAPRAKSGFTQDEIFPVPRVDEPEEKAVEAQEEPPVTEAPAEEAAPIAEPPQEAESADEVKAAPKAVGDTAVIDIAEEEKKKPAFTVRRLSQIEDTRDEDDENTVTANEIAHSLPKEETAPIEGRMENGWYNETEEFEVMDVAPNTENKPADDNRGEHPKFGQLRFGTDYDLADEDDNSSRGFGLFRKKK